MSFILLTAGAVFALIFLIVSFIRGLGQNSQTNFFSTLLAFLATLLPITALVIEQQQSQGNNALFIPAITLAVVMLAASALVMFVESRKPERTWNRSNGILGVGGSILIIVAAFVTPTITNLLPSLPSPMQTAAASGDASSSQPSPVLQVVSEATGLETGEIRAQIDGGKTLRQIVEENGGNAEEVITESVTVTREQIEAGVEAGEIPQAQANFMLGSIETMMPQAFDGQLPAQAMTMLLGNSAPDNQPQQVAQVSTAAPDAAFSPTPAPTATPTNVPFTPTATITPFFWSSPTPTLTPTFSGDCAGQINLESNVNMRQGPNTDYGLIRSVPAGSEVIVNAQSEDGAWMYIEFEGERGWVSGDLVTLDGQMCTILPTQMP